MISVATRCVIRGKMLEGNTDSRLKFVNQMEESLLKARCILDFLVVEGVCKGFISAKVGKLYWYL